MKIYFAGPLFTPYVRKFIAEHAEILRRNGIDPFVPHAQFDYLITRQKVETLRAAGALASGELSENITDADLPEAVSDLIRRGRLTREQFGLPQMTPETIFDSDYAGLLAADAVVALLDGTQVDDGTACEIGIFCAMMRRNPGKKGIIGFAADTRCVARASHGYGLNMFVLGAIEECGPIFTNFDDVVAQLKAWAGETQTGAVGA